MHSDKDDDQTYRIDEEHFRILKEIETATQQSVKSQMWEGIEMYIKHKKGGDDHLLSIFSPVIFERPYRSHDQ